MRFFACLLLSVAALGFSRRVDACGSTPLLVDALLPPAGASDVPLNAALITSSNVSGTDIWLREAAPSGADEAEMVIPIDVDCEVGPEGAVCVARPSEPLEPDTRYTWSAAIAADGYEGNAFEPLPWREFTTGSEMDLEPLQPETVNFDIVSDRIFTDHPCGLDRSVELDFVPHDLTEPVVLNFAGFTPSYVMQATLLTPQMETARTTLFSPPDCLSPVAFDQIGRQLSLANLCLSDVSEPQYVGPNGDPIAAPASADMSSCALSVRPTSPLAGVALALALLARRARHALHM